MHRKECTGNRPTQIVVLSLNTFMNRDVYDHVVNLMMGEFHTPEIS